MEALLNCEHTQWQLSLGSQDIYDNQYTQVPLTFTQEYCQSPLSLSFSDVSQWRLTLSRKYVVWPLTLC